MIDHPLPEIIRPVLDDYLAQMDVHLPGLLDGWCCSAIGASSGRCWVCCASSTPSVRAPSPPSSKPANMTWQHVPLHWRWLIQEALRIRTGGKPSFYHCRLSRALEARKFLLYIIQTCNSEFDA